MDGVKLKNLEAFDYNAAQTVKPQRLTQILAAFTVAMGAFALGNVLAWTSPTKDFFVNQGLNDATTSWIGATMALGGAVVVIPIGTIMDFSGRRITMLALVLPFVAGWLIIEFAQTVWMYILGRFITGMMGGAFSVTVPAYTSEIADDEVRGMLGSFFQLILVSGILFIYIMGAAHVSVPNITYVCAAVPLLFAVMFFYMPETPIFLLKQGKEKEARKALQWFRGRNYNIDEEIRVQKEALEAAEKEKLSFTEAFSTRASKKGLFIAIGLMTFLQLSGVNAVIFYASYIFKSTGSDMDEDMCAVIIGLVQVISTFISTLFVDRIGRRILLLLSGSVMCVCSILLGVFFFLKDKDDPVADRIGWLPLLSLCLFIVAFSLGYGPIPWMMIGELFPQNIKGPASSISCMMNWIFAFFVTKFFSDMNNALGGGPSFWIFAVISALGTLFVFVFVSETKGKSLLDIQRELGGGEEKSPYKEVLEIA